MDPSLYEEALAEAQKRGLLDGPQKGITPEVSLDTIISSYCHADAPRQLPLKCASEWVH